MRPSSEQKIEQVRKHVRCLNGLGTGATALLVVRNALGRQHDWQAGLTGQLACQAKVITTADRVTANTCQAINTLALALSQHMDASGRFV